MFSNGVMQCVLCAGHVEYGEEDNDKATALRELREETGVAAEEVNFLPHFMHEEVYYPTYKRFGGEKVVTFFMFVFA